MPKPEKCGNCRFFHQTEEVKQYGREHPDLQVHGVCRRYAPGKEAESLDAPVIVRFPAQTVPDDNGNLVSAADLARRLAEDARSGVSIVLPNNRDKFGNYQWGMEFTSSRGKAPGDWCGEWEPADGLTVASIHADWLEQQGGCLECVRKLRSLDDAPGTPAPAPARKLTAQEMRIAVTPACPRCGSEDILNASQSLDCRACGHSW